jgi:uncharacterized protein YndB with AHSA1/START domain
VPRVTREVTLDAPLEEVWRIVSDPYSFPRWWPHVVRVEDVEDDAWTKVLRTPRGNTVRADFTRTELEPQRRVAWRQELEESPFERIFSSAVTEVELASTDEGGTRVALTSEEKVRGRFRVGGGFIVKRASRRRLDDALHGLSQALGGVV